MDFLPQNPQGSIALVVRSEMLSDAGCDWLALAEAFLRTPMDHHRELQIPRYLQLRDKIPPNPGPSIDSFS